MKHVKILGLGHPRTGTGFTSNTLKLFNLNVGHEEIESDGIVAWQLVAEKGPWPWMKKVNKAINTRPSYEYLIYNVRNPYNSIPSIILTDDFKESNGITSLDYRRDAIGVPYSSNRVEQAILSIITFDTIISSLNPNLIYRIEDQYKELFDFANDISNSNIKYVEPEKKVNSREHDGWNTLQNELNKVRPFYKLLINNYCDKHGYDRMFDGMVNEPVEQSIHKLDKKGPKKPKVSVIMMSYLSDYAGARTNPIPKFHRAIESFLNQSYENTELIIISDGCELTNQEYNKRWLNNHKVNLIRTEKTEHMWPGEKRQIGIDKSSGDWIVYLDTDDVLHPNHISKIVDQIDDDIDVILNRGYALADKIIKLINMRDKNGKKVILDRRRRWVPIETLLDAETKPCFLMDDNLVFYEIIERKFEQHGTSRIFHRKDIPIKWENRDARGEDIVFSKKLMEYLPYKKIDQPTYIVCHVPQGTYKKDV